MFNNIFEKYRATSKEAQETEGNAFTKALMAARKNGDSHFVVSGKRYKCEDYMEKTECPQCEGKGCDHCDGKGYHESIKKESVEEAMDPVKDKEAKKKFADRDDKDIDNDGDVDSSDKFLHKRRKAIAKSKKEDEPKGGEDTAVMNPKKEDKVSKEGADPDTVRMMKANPKMQKTGGPGGMKGLNKKAQKYTKAALRKEEASIRDKLMSIWEDAAGGKRKKDQNRDDGADATSGSAKKMKDGHGNPEVDNTDEKGHDDASKAGKAVKSQAKARSSGDNTASGDRNVINKVKEAYASMYEMDEGKCVREMKKLHAEKCPKEEMYRKCNEKYGCSREQFNELYEKHCN